MKGLKISIVLILTLIFSLINVSDVKAVDCYSIEESFIDTESWEVVGEGSGDVASGFTRTRDNKKFTLIDGQSVCGTKGGYFKTAIYKTCVGGEIVETTCSGDKAICEYVDKKPECSTITNINNPCPLSTIQGSKYNNRGVEDTIDWTVSRIKGDTYCIDNEVRQCNFKTGKWDITIKKCTVPKCEMELKGPYGSFPMDADCKYVCSPESNYKDERCVNSNDSILQVCEYSGWKTYPITYKGADCKSCNYNNSGKVECIKEGEKSCYLYNGEQIAATKPNQADQTVKTDKKYCHNKLLLICTEKGSQSGVYNFLKDCSKEKEKTECGYYNNVLDCITPEQAGKDPRNQINISTNSSDDFWCKGGTTHINTAIGCIPITIDGLVSTLLPNIFGIAGGIAFLMMVYGFVMISTSSGDEKKVQEAQKIITSAITGLLVSIFALFLYKLIAVDILHIPGIN